MRRLPNAPLIIKHSTIIQKLMTRRALLNRVCLNRKQFSPGQAASITCRRHTEDARTQLVVFDWRNQEKSDRWSMDDRCFRKPRIYIYIASTLGSQTHRLGEKDLDHHTNRGDAAPDPSRTEPRTKKRSCFIGISKPLCVCGFLWLSQKQIWKKNRTDQNG